MHAAQHRLSLTPSPNHSLGVAGRSLQKIWTQPLTFSRSKKFKKWNERKASIIQKNQKINSKPENTNPRNKHAAL